MTITKFNEETCKCLVDNYSKGLTITDCANIAGIDRRTVHRWIEKGEKDVLFTDGLRKVRKPEVANINNFI